MASNSLFDRFVSVFGQNGHSKPNQAYENYRNRDVVDGNFVNYELRAERLREGIAELQLELEDVGWRKVTDGSDGVFEFDRDAIRKICRRSRLMFLKNPIINRGVSIQAIYVWGRGVEISTRDDDIKAIVDRFLNDPGNKAELTSHKAQVMKECDLQVDGNIFFALFTNTENGAVSVRTLPVDQVDRIVHNPDDRKDPWFYRRIHQRSDIRAQMGRITPKLITTYYRDWEFDVDVRMPESRPQLPSGEEYAPDNVTIHHVKVGGLSEMQFGVPETYQSLDWAFAYKDFLSDWATIVKSLSRFAWKMTGPADANALAAAQAALGTTVTLESSETNPGPAPGSMWYESGEFNLQAMPKTGATIQADDGRRLLLMALSGLGIPETFTGDVSVGTLATASSLDRPTELKFLDRQTLWGDTLRELITYAIYQAAKHQYRGLRLERVDDEQSPDGSRLVVFRENKEVDIYVDINFPPILERDIEKMVRSVVTASTLGGKQIPPNPVIPIREMSRKLMQAIDIGDVDGQLEKLYPGGSEPPTPTPAPAPEQRDDRPTPETD